MELDEIRQRIGDYRARGLKLFASSSFQTQSVPLLHILSVVDPTIPVYMINTGFLFPETLRFRDDLAARFGLEVRTVASAVPKSQQIGPDGRLLFASDPDYCCELNKVLPLAPVLESHDVWINGVRADQSSNRRRFRVEERTPQGAVRFHPLLDWDSRQVEAYLREHSLPRHPLDEQYLSIGCLPCTRRIDLEVENDPRLARWFGMKKTECGLHTDLVELERKAD
jgi:phosphoadenosine phosphosulfate reductase